MFYVFLPLVITFHTDVINEIGTGVTAFTPGEYVETSFHLRQWRSLFFTSAGADKGLFKQRTSRRREDWSRKPPWFAQQTSIAAHVQLRPAVLKGKIAAES